MPPYRMLAIDLDGTLLMPDGTVSARNRQAIARALSAGLLVCFATGRNFTESQAILDQVGHYDTAVFVGGAMVIDTRKGQTLHRMGMEAQLAREVSALFESLGHAALALQDTQEAGIDYLATAGLPLNDATRQWMEVTLAKVRFVPSLAQQAHDHTIRIGIVAQRDETRRVQALVEERFGPRVVCHSLWVPAYGVEVLEAFDPSVNKWQGILHVARMHGVAPEQIVAVGDDVNDLAMLRSAGLGVAMGNAKPEVQAIAGRIIGRNDQDGLAEFIEELVDRQMLEPDRPARG